MFDKVNKFSTGLMVLAFLVMVIIAIGNVVGG
jgi:hypothetical protein